ncbi:hypothetical protein EOS_27270 [Caballeronia mineralivorans PML1(12)]|uniref:Uncharacterized protein n=1 Tax=Caballeronia mineralivorans PML1(12) TaxID=908627 RepID=A0A0J1CR70_9BURK|nr:hypothetical protein [Caballeronia mineralivorans]KLU23122.1 hypothetical protein EOS_27270 [Caballeronia mineralivorans PML1(12)]
MSKKSLEKIKEKLLKDGFGKKALVSDEMMREIFAAVSSEKNVIATPSEELRFIEGLMNLPIGYIKEFKVIPKSGYEVCSCGRVPSALEIVQTAMKHRIHETSLMRDTLIGFNNLVELSTDGRSGECVKCGRMVIMETYATASYIYT